MTGLGRDAHLAHRRAVHLLLSLLVAVAGLVCTYAASAAHGDQLRAGAQGGLTGISQVQASVIDDGAAHEDVAEPRPRCSDNEEQQAEGPTSTRPEAPAPTPLTGPNTAAVHAADHARVAPGRGGPAPPPSAPSLEALSVLRV